MFIAVVTAIIAHETEVKNIVETTNDLSNNVLNDGLLYILPTLLTGLFIILIFSYNNWLYKLLGDTSPEDIALKAGTFKVAEINIQSYLLSLLCGFIAGIGLSLSTMCNPSSVLSFLDFISEDGWNPTLAFVMGGGVFVNIITFYYMSSRDYPPLLCEVNSSKLNGIIKYGNHPDNLKIDKPLIMGAILFGIGWGIVGICPGPAIVAFGAYRRDSAILLPSLFGGFAIYEIIYGKSLLSYSNWFKRTPVSDKENYVETNNNTNNTTENLKLVDSAVPNETVSTV